VERDFEEKGRKRKKNGPPLPPSACSKKKTKKKLSLSLFSSFFYKNTYILINMSGARLIVFYSTTLSLSLSLQGRERFLVRFLSEKQLCPSFRAYQKWISSLFFFVFASKCVVCVGGSFISFFCVCAAPARARVSFVLFDDDDDDDDDDDARDDPTRAAGELIYVHAGRSRGRERQ
jgi:hypothetical protein